MYRLNALAAILVLVAILLSAQVATASASNSLTVQVYSDGSVLVTQGLSVNGSAGSVIIPLLTTILSDVVATDQSGSPLSWKISGNNITVYTLGATGVTLSYETLALTNKTGIVWTLGFVTDYNTTVVLPKSSTVSSISGTPYSLTVQGGSPVASLSAGKWEISYGVLLVSQQTTTSGSLTTGGTSTGNTGGGTISGFLGVTGSQATEIIVALVALSGAAVGVLWWRRRLRLAPQGAELRPDDVQVLNFIQEQGGKVLEPEIRMKFALPKTSGWRQIKRLERLGYVKVTKIGSQNQIELVKKREGT